jgi:hypothetical protein
MGSSTWLQTISVPMKVGLFRLDPDGFASLRCLHCCELLELNQPAEDEPERLIGVCPHCCGSWHIINLMLRRSEALIVLLPPSQTFQETFSSADGNLAQEFR